MPRQAYKSHVLWPVINLHCGWIEQFPLYNECIKHSKVQASISTWWGFLQLHKCILAPQDAGGYWNAVLDNHKSQSQCVHPLLSSCVLMYSNTVICITTKWIDVIFEHERKFWEVGLAMRAYGWTAESSRGGERHSKMVYMPTDPHIKLSDIRHCPGYVCMSQIQIPFLYV